MLQSAPKHHPPLPAYPPTPPKKKAAMGDRGCYKYTHRPPSHPLPPPRWKETPAIGRYCRVLPLAFFALIIIIIILSSKCKGKTQVMSSSLPADAVGRRRRLIIHFLRIVYITGYRSLCSMLMTRRKFWLGSWSVSPQKNYKHTFITREQAHTRASFSLATQTCPAEAPTL